MRRSAACPKQATRSSGETVRFWAFEIVPRMKQSHPWVAARWEGEGTPVYRYEAASLAGFIQQLAVCYLANGYWFYVTGRIPEDKPVNAVDEKLLARYDIDVSKWARGRRRKLGLAGVHYLRHERFFVLLASRGAHEFFRIEAN